MIADIELRWQKRNRRLVFKEHKLGETAIVEYENILQFRKRVQVEAWVFSWTDWQDVPVVEE